MLKENVLADAWKSSIIQIRDSRWEEYFTHVLRPIKKYLDSQNQLIISDNKFSTAYTNRENFINPISYVYIHIQIHKYALRVLPAETWLTVYRRLRILKFWVCSNIRFSSSIFLITQFLIIVNCNRFTIFFVSTIANGSTGSVGNELKTYSRR